MSSLIGRKLGQYEVVELLGKGGMATVYKGYQASLDRYVAIKVLPPHPGMDDQFIERFRLEAKTIGSLQNPNILPLYDYGAEDDVLYLVMAYVAGGSLADYLDGALEPRQIEKWLRGIASGLDFAHRRGIVHRDIKPANILIDSDGHPLLADFGVVKMLASGTNLTGTSLVGTPAYMSPEQGQGLEIDGRSDVYSLGVMVYEMLTGQHPYRADTPMQTILKHITDPVPDIMTLRPDLPAALGDVMARVLAKDPKDRYSTAIAFAEDFSKAIHNNDDSLVAARKSMPLESAPLPTVKLDAPTSAAPTTGTQVASQTIVVRETTNPLVIIGGFGIIALVILVTAVLLITQLNAPGAPALPTPTAQTAAVPTPAVRVFNVGDRYRGLMKYNSLQAVGDTLNMTLTNVRATPADKKYVVWLVNTTSDDTLNLGDLSVFSGGEASFSYTNPDAGDDAANALPVLYNALLITLEDRTAKPAAPSAEVMYSGWVPAAAQEALALILFSAEDGINGQGLVVSALAEARIGRQHAGLAAAADTVPGQRTHAEHTVNIYSGTQEDLTGDGRGQNPGRGKGVYRYLDQMDAVVTTLLNEQEVMPELLTQAENIRVCTQNVRIWLDELMILEREIAAAETVEAARPQAERSTVLARMIMDGDDPNQNAIVEPFEGECGLNQILDIATQLANITVLEGPLDARN